MPEKKPKAYLIVMSRGGDIQIDEEEVSKVLNAMRSGASAVLRRGIFNPSFYVSIKEDEHRLRVFFDELNNIVDGNRRAKSYGIGEIKALPEFEKLSDIFEGLSLPGREDIKKLN